MRAKHLWGVKEIAISHPILPTKCWFKQFSGHSQTWWKRQTHFKRIENKTSRKTRLPWCHSWSKWLYVDGILGIKFIVVDHLHRKIGLEIFASPFDESAVDMLEELDCVSYKIASADLCFINVMSPSVWWVSIWKAGLD